MKIASILRLVVPLLIPLSFVQAESFTPEYRVTDVDGEVGFIPQGQTEISPLTKDVSLEAGDQVVTGKTGRVELATKAGTVMELKENSTMEVESFSTNVSRFFLRVGRMLGKFAPSSETKHTYAVRTPIAVASVRGTELALCVEEDGATQGGVIEGAVAFGPLEEKEAISPNEPSVQSADWTEGEVMVEENKGIALKPQERPERLAEVPPVIVKDLVWFPKVRERIPALRERWKDLPPPAQRELRQRALRDRVQWKVPPQHLRQLNSPRERMKDQFKSPPKPVLERRRRSSVQPRRSR